MQTNTASVHLYSYFLGGSDSKDSTCNAGDLGSIPELGISPAGGQKAYLGFPGSSAGKEPTCNAGDPSSNSEHEKYTNQLIFSRAKFRAMCKICAKYHRGPKHKPVSS